MTTKTLDLQAIKSLFNNAKVETVTLDDLELHAGTQQRQKPNTEALEAYQEAMEAGEADNFPPVRVVRLTETVTLEDDCTLEPGALILADGFTRTGAAEKAGIETFKMEVVDGTLEDAIQFSYVANSMHGSKLDTKDYQALIRKIYLQDPAIKKGDLARGLGCAAKTVSKALGVVEEEFKEKGRTMMDSGYSDKEIAQAVHKTEQTVKNWRAAYEEEKQQPEPEAPTVNPMKMRFEDVLGLDDLDKQISLLDMLQTRVTENQKKAGIEPGLPVTPEVTPEVAPEAPQEQLELNEASDMPEMLGGPQDIPEEPEQPQGTLSPWEILGRELEPTAALANPKASLNRTVRNVIKAGEHSEEVVKAAFDAALTEIDELKNS